MFNLQQMAAYLTADEPTILALARDGAIPPPVLIANRMARWTPEALAEWRNGGCMPCEPMAPDAFTRMRQIQIEEDLNPPKRGE